MEDEWREQVSDAGCGKGGVQADWASESSDGDSYWMGCHRVQDHAGSNGSSLEVS